VTRLNFVVQTKNNYIIIFSTHFNYYYLLIIFYKFNLFKGISFVIYVAGLNLMYNRKKIGSLFFLSIFIIVTFFVTLFYRTQMYNQRRSEWFHYVINLDNGWKIVLKQIGAGLTSSCSLKPVGAGWSMLE